MSVKDTFPHGSHKCWINIDYTVMTYLCTYIHTISDVSLHAIMQHHTSKREPTLARRVVLSTTIVSAL